jgi:deoxyribonuclease (pyrimidine dimer)
MRINIINPKYLTDNHLVAEYRETKMSTYNYVRSKNSKKGIDKSRISDRYTLGEGHGYMWYNKFGYINERFNALVDEMRNRGFQTNFTELNFSGIDSDAFGDFHPTQEDKRINLDRILERISRQPEWYKYYGKNIKDWNSFYEELFQQEKL